MKKNIYTTKHIKGQKVEMRMRLANHNERHIWHLNLSHSPWFLVSLPMVCLNTSVNVSHWRGEIRRSSESRLELEIDPRFSFTL